MSQLVRFSHAWMTAQVTLQDLSRGFRSRDYNIQIWFALFIAVLAAVIIVLLVLAVRRERRTRLYSRPKLFAELCVAHEITWSQRWLLQELAELANAEGPEILFVRPDLLALAVDRWRQKNPQKPDTTLVSLQRRLFSTSSPPSSAMVRNESSAETSSST